MKTSLFKFIVLLLVITACNNNDIETAQEPVAIDMSDFYLYTEDLESDIASKSNDKSKFKSCFTMQNLNNKLKENPSLEKKMFDIEYHTRAVIAGKKGGNDIGGGKPDNGGNNEPTPSPYDGQVSIPVIVNVLYQENTDQDISDAQIASQIDALNAAFNGNDATNNISVLPEEFNSLKAGDIKISFYLAGIKRRETTNTSWPYSSAEEMKHSELGGIDATDTSKNLNIWVVSQMPYNGGRILGYAQFPGGDPETDGIVMDYNDFGTEGTAVAPSDLGKVAVHEVGHWLNLRHIWGDGRCRQDDFVSDTPNSDRANRGCPTYPTVHCRSNDMTMNYMDYTDDACLYMFTKGQTDRMRALFAAGGARESIIK